MGPRVAVWVAFLLLEESLLGSGTKFAIPDPLRNFKIFCLLPSGAPSSKTEESGQITGNEIEGNLLLPESWQQRKCKASGRCYEILLCVNGTPSLDIASSFMKSEAADLQLPRPVFDHFLPGVKRFRREKF